MRYKLSVKHSSPHPDQQTIFKTMQVLKNDLKKLNSEGKGRGKEAQVIGSALRKHRHYAKMQSNLEVELTRDKFKKRYRLSSFDELPKVVKALKNEAVQDIRTKRAARKSQLQREPKEWRKYGKRFYTVDSVMEKPGMFLELNKIAKLRSIGEPKLPKTSENHIGVEIEFASFLDQDQIAKLFFDAGLLDYVQLQEEFIDGRESGEMPYELCVVAPEKEIRAIMKRVCRVLNEEVDANVTYGCGLHIHIDARNRNIKQMFDNLYHSQEVLYSMIKGTRRNNRHVRMMPTKLLYPLRPRDNSRAGERDIVCFNHEGKCTYKVVEGKQTGHCDCPKDQVPDRYFGLNLWSYRKTNTMEVRMHSGTTSAVKINNWIDILLKIVESEKIVKPLVSLDEMLKVVEIDKNLSNYMQRRIENFQGSRR